jgi:hypothetical protein
MQLQNSLIEIEFGALEIAENAQLECARGLNELK